MIKLSVLLSVASGDAQGKLAFIKSLIGRHGPACMIIAISLRASMNLNLNLTLRQLKAFLGVAESSNFTRTAQKLHLSQAALSATIRELEIQLRSRLFDRTTRNVQLTDAGRDFLPTAITVVRDLEAACLRLQELERHGVAQLRLGFTPMLAAHVVPEVLEAFQYSHSDIVIDVIDTSPQELQRQVEVGEIDAAFGAFFQKASGITQTPMFPSTLVAAYSSASTEINSEMTWADLAAYPLIVLSDGSPIQQLANAALKKAGAQIQQRMAVNHLETAIAMASKGLGVAIIPSFSAIACQRYAVQMAVITPPVGFNFYRIIKTGREINAALDAFSNELTNIANPGYLPAPT